MLHNVVELDGEMRAASLEHDGAAAVFFDFAAAFPSMAHDFLLDVLARLALPQGFRDFGAATVARSRRAAPCTRASPCAQGSARGVPSPLLFALCGDLFLRRLTAALPGDLVRAYADDVGLVSGDIFGWVEVFVPLFRVFRTIPELQLNLPSVRGKKSWQLSETPGRSLPRLGRRARPPLGRLLGPDGADHMWGKAFARYEKPIVFWAQLGLGLHHTTVVYNTCVVSVLGFLAQLAPLPTTWASLETAALRRLVPGLGRWATPEDFHDLARRHGLPQDFVDLTQASLVARFRVAHREADAEGGLHTQREARRVGQVRRLEHGVRTTGDMSGPSRSIAPQRRAPAPAPP